MILIGQFDSPFVRRVAITMRLYGIKFEHRPWSTFADAAQIAAHNPLRRVPTLLLDDGEVLVDSVTILDHLDETIGPDKALIPNSGPTRRQIAKITALATGLADKSVSLVYERLLHQPVSQRWTDRCIEQITAVLGTLNADRTTRTTPCWFGPTLSHADIAVACAIRFNTEAHGTSMTRWPALKSHAEHCEALEPFQAIAQTFLPP
ncbi:MAG TPA: glutathione S-transferase family protein [Rhodopila sp.]|nr:glutathione S-transferase family protein [Rhodopila sp.]